MQICRKRERKKFDLDENFTTNKESSRAGIFKKQGTYFFLVKNKTPTKHSMLGKRVHIGNASCCIKDFYSFYITIVLM